MTMTLDSERETFEKWVQTTSGWKVCRARNKPMHLRQNADGSYNDFRVNDRWFAWQARAHLAQPAQSVDVEKVREVIAHLRSFRSNTPPTWSHLDDAADKLEAALPENGNA